jgi:DHA1 family multidrug resistance protein-like MFS transporter
VLFTSTVGAGSAVGQPSAGSREPTGSGLLALLGDRGVRQATLLAVALFLPVGLYETVWGKHISNLGGSSYIIALSVALYGLPYMVVAPLGGRLGDRVGSVRVALIGSIGLVLITVVTGLPRNYWALLPLGVVEASISAIAYTNALAAMSKACPSDQQAAGQGLAGAASIGAAGLMAMVAGPLFAWGGPVVAFATTGAIVAVGAATAHLIDPSAAKRPNRRAITDAVREPS